MTQEKDKRTNNRLCMLVALIDIFVIKLFSYDLKDHTFMLQISASTTLHKNDVRFIFTTSCLQDGACLIHVMYACLRIVVSNTYCVLSLFYFHRLVNPMLPFLSKLHFCDFCFRSSLTSCVPYVASLSRLHFCDFRFRFSLTFM